MKSYNLIKKKKTINRVLTIHSKKQGVLIDYSSRSEFLTNDELETLVKTLKKVLRDRGYYENTDNRRNSK
jgi:hypothetical protein